MSRMLASFTLDANQSSKFALSGKANQIKCFFLMFLSTLATRIFALISDGYGALSTLPHTTHNYLLTYKDRIKLEHTSELKKGL